MRARVEKPIATKDETEFLLSEITYYKFDLLDSFKKLIKGAYTKCDICGVYYFVGCELRCECKNG